jgi:hypothetical protein
MMIYFKHAFAFACHLSHVDRPALTIDWQIAWAAMILPFQDNTLQYCIRNLILRVGTIVLHADPELRLAFLDEVIFEVF